MHFYSYKLDEVKKLTQKEFETLSNAMEQNMARERLNDFEISIVPKMHSKDREKVRKRLYKQAYPENFKRENVARNMQDLVSKMRSQLGG